MSTLLFGVSATDIVTFSAVPVILATIALLASYLPARRATQETGSRAPRRNVAGQTYGWPCLLARRLTTRNMFLEI